jgi:hypothetical protein
MLATCPALSDLIALTNDVEEFSFPGYNAMQSSEISACCLLQACFSLSLHFDPEDRGDMFLRNAGLLPSNNAELCPQKTEPFIATVVRTSNSRRLWPSLMSTSSSLLSRPLFFV